MAAFARTELDLSAWPAGQPGCRPAVRRPRRKLIGRDVFLLEARPRRARRGGPDRLPRASTTPARRPSRPRSWSPPCPATRPISRRSWPTGGAGPFTSAFRAAARSAQLLELAERNAGRDARPRAGSLAGRPGQDPGRPRGARRGARPARPADADRVLRHQQLPGQPSRSAAWSSSRTASRGPASTAGSGSRRSRVPNDFASHQEVLRRRFRRAAAAEEGSAEELRWRLPDLVIVDGGKGQVSAAAEVSCRARPARPPAGRPGQGARGAVPARSRPSRSSCRRRRGALYLVQRLRDEAHRFAITYHRDLRAKASVRSAFDDLPGVGPKRRQALLRVFGSTKRIREAPVEQIAAVPGIGAALASRIKATLEA